jgi:acetyl esterase/lipase
MKVTAALGLAVVTFLLGLWTWLPAPTYAFLPLSVGAPELSPWLLLSALAAAFLAIARRGRSRVRRATLFIAAAATIAPGSVLARIPGTIERCDREMARALGPDYLRDVPDGVRSAMRATPVRARDLFAGLPADSVAIVRGLPFSPPGATPMTLDVYRPAGGGGWPVVLQIYGGAWQNGAPDDDAALAAALAASGYVVVATDNRHAPRWRWPAQRDDIRAAAEWIQAHAAEYGGDASRLALLGRSSGAQLALTAAAQPGFPPVRAIVTYYGPVDLTNGYRNPPRPDVLNLRKVESELLGGTPDEVPDAYRDASPISSADRPHPPVLIVAGGRDGIVYERFGAALHAKLRDSGTSVFLVIPWANHAFDAVPFGPSAQLALYYTQRFLAWAMRG